MSIKKFCVLAPIFAFFLSCAHEPVSIKSRVDERALRKEEIETRFILPTRPAKNVIYLMTAFEKNHAHKPTNINLEIDWRSLQSGANLSLFSQLLALEIEVRKIILKDPNLLRAVIYVGQAKDLLSRAQGHKRDIMNPIKQWQTTKGRWLNGTLKNHMVKMAYLVNNIPKEHLNVAECLIGHLFAVQDFKGSAKLGDTKSWQQLIEYFSSSQRLKHLERLGLLDRVEAYREQIREMILPFQSPWGTHR